jgi:nicotinamidase-related amidase
MSDLRFNPQQTALVIVDVQNFTVKLPLVPHNPASVVANNKRLIEACRAKGALVVFVRVGHGGARAAPSIKQPVDQGFGGFEMPAEAYEIAADLAPAPGDLIIDKYNWGAFFGTNLDIQLRRRGINTLIVSGIVTNIGVDTTMRHAQERNYSQVLAHDACSAFSAEEHEFILKKIAPRLSRVRSTDEIIAALKAS